MSSHQFHHPPHFIQIINKHTFCNGDLWIPPSFVNIYWKEITSPVIVLRLLNGAKWEVNWIKRNADVWLTNKWKEFAQFYSLKRGHFLMFRYEGNSHFQVVICDLSASEIQYPSFKHTNQTLEDNNGFSSRKKTKINPKETPKCVETEIPHPRRTKVHHAKKPRKRGRRGIRNMKGGFSNSEAMESDEESSRDYEFNSALKKAQAFQALQTENHSFIRLMHKSYIQKHLLVIPYDCLTVHQQKGDMFVTLQVPEGRTWNAKVKLNSSSKQIMLTTGWMNFVENNSLEIGDVCLFEKINSAGDTFRVYIFRAKEESHSPHSQSSGDGANQRKQKGVQNKLPERNHGGIAKKSSSTIRDSEYGGHKSKETENHFTICFESFQLDRKALTIPIKFLRKYFTEDVKEVTLKVGERSWPMKLDYYPRHSYGRFSEGWRSFVRDCNLKEGDVCHFKLIDMQNFVLQVTFPSPTD